MGAEKDRLAKTAQALAPMLRSISSKRMEQAKYEGVENPYAESNIKIVVTDQENWQRVQKEIQSLEFQYLVARNAARRNVPARGCGALAAQQVDLVVGLQGTADQTSAPCPSKISSSTLREL